jgi:hypothetical protein
MCLRLVLVSTVQDPAGSATVAKSVESVPATVANRLAGLAGKTLCTEHAEVVYPGGCFSARGTDSGAVQS